MGFNERRIMKNLYWFLLLLLAFPLLASAQSLEVSGGYAHISGVVVSMDSMLARRRGFRAGFRSPLTMTVHGTTRISGWFAIGTGPWHEQPSGRQRHSCAGDSLFRLRPSRSVLVGLALWFRRRAGHVPTLHGGIQFLAGMAFLQALCPSL
jgi:hypothetical protein